MTLTEIRAEMVMKTERKIQEMKSRGIVLPKHQTHMCELCDQLSQEIYDFAVQTTVQIADRNHLRHNVPTLLEEVQEDICALTNGAVDIMLSTSMVRNYDLANSRRVPGRLRKVSRAVSTTGSALVRLFHGLCCWIRGRWVFRPARVW